MKFITKQDVQSLVDELGPTSVALASGTRDRNDVQLWAQGRELLTVAQTERLSFLKEVYESVSAAEGAATTRAWLNGSDCVDMTMSPLEAIRENRFDDVRASASRLINDQWS